MNSENYHDSSSDVDHQRTDRKRSFTSRSRSSSKNSVKSNRERGSSQSSEGNILPVEQEKVVPAYESFDYDLVLEQDQLQILIQKYGETFSSLIDQTKVSSMQIDRSKTVPEMKGLCLKIQSNSRENKYKAISKILRSIYDAQSTKGKDFAVIVLIPEGMVSLLIGKRGKQINAIKDESGALIVANQPITGMNQRTIEITGLPDNISKAIDIIYDLMSQRAAIVEQPSKLPTQANFEDIIIKARFPIQYNLRSYLINQKNHDRQNFLDIISKQYETKIEFDKRSQFYLQNDETVITIEGKFIGLSKAISTIFQKMEEYSDHYKRRRDFINKILIPAKFTTKLIGKEGCMISDIAKQSEGAKIKIISSKNDPKDKRECVIEVTGQLPSKIKACCIIIEKIEQFRHGGPILKDAKALRENLSEQYKNSVYDQSQVDMNYQYLIPEKEVHRSRSRSYDRYDKNRKYSGHYSPRKSNFDPYYQGRSRSRDKYEKRDYFERDYDRERYYKNDKRRREDFDKDRYRETERDRYRVERDSERERIEGGYRDSRHREKREYRMSESPKHRKKEEDPPKKLKIPIILTNKLVQEFSQNSNKIKQQIFEQTQCKIDIEKEKRLILHGTVEQNTNAFRKIQQEFLRIGSD